MIGVKFGVLITDLSMAFDCLDHELLFAKLNTYGLSLPTLRIIHDYLSHRKQRTKINCSYSEWLDFFGSHKVRFWGQFYLVYIFSRSFPDDIGIVNFADNNTSYVTADYIDGVIASLQNTSNTLFNSLVTIFLKVMPINTTY